MKEVTLSSIFHRINPSPIFENNIKIHAPSTDYICKNT